MGKKKTTPITINNTEYVLEDMTSEQQLMINHVSDLNRKIESTKFNLDQLSVGRDAFLNMLTQQLETEKATGEIN
jgi:hypothetical protein|tara:strand:+ start:371 stop:595 length:225 start_codon:yes stop_codon:yes gene_type:complete